MAVNHSDGSYWIFLLELKDWNELVTKDPLSCWDKPFSRKSRHIWIVCLNFEVFNIQRRENHLGNTRKIIGSDVTIIITKRITYGNRIFSVILDREAKSVQATLINSQMCYGIL